MKGGGRNELMQVIKRSSKSNVQIQGTAMVDQMNAIVDCQARGGDERLFNQHMKSHACLFMTSGTPYYFCLSQTCGFECESMDT